MADLETVEVVRTETEAELLCSLLETAGIAAIYRVTNQGAGAFDGVASGGPQEILVRPEDLASAREVLAARVPPE